MKYVHSLLDPFSAIYGIEKGPVQLGHQAPLVGRDLDVAAEIVLLLFIIVLSSLEQAGAGEPFQRPRMHSGGAGARAR